MNTIAQTTHQPPAAHLLIVAVLVGIVVAVLLVSRIRRRRNSPAGDQQAGARHLSGPSNSKRGEIPEGDQTPRRDHEGG